MRKIFLFLLLFTASLLAQEDSTVEISSASSDSVSPLSVEQEILAEPVPATEMVRRARTLLLRALQEKDKERATRFVHFLDGQYSDNVCSFSGMEKGLVFLHLGVYDAALTLLVQERRLLGSGSRRAESREERCVAEVLNANWKTASIIQDELFLYLNQFYARQSQKQDSLVSVIQESTVDVFFKEAAPAFLPVIFTISWGNAEDRAIRHLLHSGTAFVQKYPMDENGRWLERYFLEPFEKRFQKTPSTTQDPIQNHLYGKSVGFEFLSGIGFLTGDLKDEFHHRFWDYAFAVPIQIYRVVFTPFISFGWIETRNNRKFSDVLWEKDSELLVYEGGVSVGVVAWDIRYIKLEPFVGIATASASLPENSYDYYYYANKPNNNYHLLRDHIETNNSLAFLAGIAGEVRLVTICRRDEEAPLNSISLRVKYTASFLDHDFGYQKMEGLSHKVQAGVGFFIW